MEKQPELDWRLERSGDHLVIAIELTNTTGSVLYVCDKLVTPRDGDLVTTERIAVLNDDEPGTVKLALAAISSDRPSAALYTPAFARLEPGATRAREVAVPLPLETWHPAGGASPIRGDADRAVLLLDYFTGEPEGWKTLSDGARTPEGHDRRMLRTEPRPLPE